MSATRLCGKEKQGSTKNGSCKKTNLEGICIAIFFRLEGSSLTIKEGRQLHILMGYIALNTGTLFQRTEYSAKGKQYNLTM
jgi:hypothetical protein